MIVLKTRRQIEKMRVSGKILASVLNQMAQMIAVGVTTAELDAEANRMIREAGGIPTFRGQPGMTDDAPPFPAATCISVNEQVIHGIPSEQRVIESGDVVSVDCGVTWNNMITDAAITVIAGQPHPEDARLVHVTRQCLQDAIKLALPGNHLHDLSAAIQARATQAGFGIVRDYCGHGVGVHLHEDPPIPNYGTPGTGPLLRPGMTLAIEPMLTRKNPRVRMLPDGWTVVTADGQPAAHFEHTILITDRQPEILTNNTTNHPKP